jgi:hypothetical protein
MIRRRVCLGAILVTLLALVGGCGGSQPSLCTEFLKIDKALVPLRDAKAKDTFESVPGLVDELADAYEGINPPAELREDWSIVVEFLRREAEKARIILSKGQVPDIPAEEDAQVDKAFTNITDYGVAECGRARGILVP